MLGQIGVALLIGSVLCSGAAGQGFLGTDWLKGLTENISGLNRNIQQNVQQLNQRIAETVRENLAQAHRITESLDKDLATGSVQQTIGGSNVVLTNNDGAKIVHSGRTSDGKAYIRESSDRIVGDTLRHVDNIYDPATKVARMYGYTLDLKDPNAKPVPIEETVQTKN